MHKFNSDGWERVTPEDSTKPLILYRRGKEFAVVDANTGEDLTAKWTEQAKSRAGEIRERVRHIIQKMNEGLS